MEINYELTPKDFYQFGKETALTESQHQPLVIMLAAIHLIFILTIVIYRVFFASQNDW